MFISRFYIKCVWVSLLTLVMDWVNDCQGRAKNFGTGLAGSGTREMSNEYEDHKDHKKSPWQHDKWKPWWNQTRVVVWKLHTNWCSFGCFGSIAEATLSFTESPFTVVISTLFFLLRCLLAAEVLPPLWSTSITEAAFHFVVSTFAYKIFPYLTSGVLPKF